MKTCEAMHAVDGAPPAMCGRMSVLLRKFHDGHEYFLCDRCEVTTEMRRGDHTDHSPDPPHYHRIPPFTAEHDGEARLASLDHVVATTPDPHHVGFSAEWIRALSLTIHHAWEERDAHAIQVHKRDETISRLRHEVAVLRRELAGTESDFGRADKPVPPPCTCVSESWRMLTGEDAPAPPSHAAGNLVICELCQGVRP